jgi:hypothetical protein
MQNSMMKIKQLQGSIVLLILLFSFESQGQKFWKQLDAKANIFQKKEIRSFKNFPKKHLLYELALRRLTISLESEFKDSSKILYLPNSDGLLEVFQVFKSSNFEKNLADKFPNIKSFTAVGVTNPASLAKLSIGTDGFHAVIFSANGETVYIDPYSKNNEQYIVYKTSDLKEEDVLFKCNVEETAIKQSFFSIESNTVNNGNLRTFRLALVCSGEYAQFHLNNQGVLASASDTDKKTAVLSAMNTSMTRVNGVFEKDLGVKMLLVAENEKVIFLNPATDNITDGDPNEMFSEVQTIADAQIGNANYDIGHIFSVAGDGLAGLGVVCISGQKARGVTGRSAPIGDPYDIDYVAHEMGHQFGATHTQNNSCNRTNISAVEPGSASTIMGYAGICAPNVQNISDAYFHSVSITQMQQNIAASGSCAILNSNGNTPPVAVELENYSIPKSTPFILTGIAADADGLSSLTYNWEQTDNEIGTMPPLAINTVGPMFRSLPSSISASRYMPALETIISGNTGTTWEVLPSVARTLNFSFLVRDNNPSGGANAREDMIVNVTDADAFTVTSQDSNVLWVAGSTQKITWNKGMTDISPINCQNVTIKLSEDGGLTFPIILSENTPNDGVEDIMIPEYVTKTARIMVAASDNIFYNVNRVNFEILSSKSTFILTNTSGVVSACDTGNDSVNFILNLDFINDFQEDVSFVATGHPVGSSVSFSPNIINADGNVIFKVSNLDGVAVQEYTINVQGKSDGITQNISVILKVITSNLDAVSLIAPTNEARGVSLLELLNWEEDSNATSYIVEVASDASFAQIVSQGAVNSNVYETTNLQNETVYFWRVKTKNNCAESAFSSVFTFTTEKASYCTSTFIDEDGGSEYIMNVSFNSINNTSDNELTTGYQDFTEINTNVLREQTREIRVTFDTAGFQDHCYVFIDWNQDSVFDSVTETYDLGTKIDDIATATFAIKVPLEAKLGKTTIRVLIEYDDPDNGYGLGACEADHLTEWGETEDYSLTVLLPVLEPNNYVLTSIDESIYNVNDGQITIATQQDEFTYELAITGPETKSSTYVLSDLPSGRYTLCATAVEAENTQCFEIDIEEGKIIIDSDNYMIKTISETCVDKNDGSISVSIKQETYTYDIKITGPDTNINAPVTDFSYVLTDLSPGVYEVCIVVKESNLEDCFEVIVVGSQPISLKVVPKKNSKNYVVNMAKGTAPFSVFINDKLLQISSEMNFEFEIPTGGKLEIKTAKECEGVYRTVIDGVLVVQNPVGNNIELVIPLGSKEPQMEVAIYDISGKLVLKQIIIIQDNSMTIPFEEFAKGVYILKLPIAVAPIKIIKR